MKIGAPSTPAEFLRQVGYVQLDTISVLARSHELVAYSRLGPVGRQAVEAAYWSTPAVAFEYYGHANCILPLESWPYFAFKRRANAGRGHPWFSVHEHEVEAVRARLGEGPVTASELGGAREGGGGWWSWSAAKIAVELLYYQGEAVCTERRGWKRVYDLAERRIPPHLLDQEPTDAECISYLVGVTARALGVGTKRDIAEYFRLTRGTQGWRIAGVLLDKAIEQLGLVPVRVEGWDEVAYADPQALERPVEGESHTTLLSPFDSLVWDRKIARRTQRLFGFSYELEAYVPREKRTQGYFVMPLLTGGRLAGFADPGRRGKTLVVRNLSIAERRDAPAMARALREAASWVGCEKVELSEGVGTELGGLLDG